jgi:hypothetical protein
MHGDAGGRLARACRRCVVSGPLATWVGEHSKASWRGRAVLSHYALAANPDGTPAADVTREDLKRRTGMSRATIGRGRQEVEQLGELQQLDAGGGRGRLSRWRVVVTLCNPEAGCWSCDLLAPLLQKRSRPYSVPASVPAAKPAPAKHVAKAKGAQAEHVSVGKGRQQSRNVLRQSPTTETVTAPTTGGAVTHPGSNDREPRSRRRREAARSGQKLDDPAPARVVIPEEARRVLAELKREGFRRRHGVDPPPDYGLDPPAATSPPTAAEASSRAGPQVAGEAPVAAGDVGQPPVIPVEDPADVTYPSDDLGAVAGPCVICQQACTSLHRVSGQVRHATCRDPVAKPAA